MRYSLRAQELGVQHKIDYVVLMAGLKAVGESTRLPLLYYRNNLDAAINLVDVRRELTLIRATLCRLSVHMPQEYRSLHVLFFHILLGGRRAGDAGARRAQADLLELCHCVRRAAAPADRRAPPDRRGHHQPVRAHQILHRGDPARRRPGQPCTRTHAELFSLISFLRPAGPRRSQLYSATITSI